MRVCCLSCRKERSAKVLPIYCTCGAVIGPQKVSLKRENFYPVNGQPRKYIVTQDTSHSDICRTNQCGYFSKGSCLKHIEKMRKRGLEVAGSVTHLDYNPKVRCPSEDPMWYVGDIGFLAISYRQMGGTETFHRTLLNSLCETSSVAGFVVYDKTLADGDFSSFVCQTGTGHEAAVRLANSCKVLVVWGLGDRLTRVLEECENKPKVISITHCDHRSAWTINYMRFQAKHSEHFVSVNKEGLATIPEERRSQARVIYNGIDSKRLRPTQSKEQIRKKLKVPMDAKLNVMLCRISPEKGIRKAIEAVRNTNQYLHVFGEPAPWAEEYYSTIKRMQTGRIKIHPPTQEVGNILHAADQLISMSDFEGFGLSMAEAMMRGVQVVGTPVGILEDFEDIAKIIPFNASFQEVIDIILSPVDTTWKARRTVREHFSKEAFVRNWTDFLSEVLNSENSTT